LRQHPLLAVQRIKGALNESRVRILVDPFGDARTMQSIQLLGRPGADARRDGDKRMSCRITQERAPHEFQRRSHAPGARTREDLAQLTGRRVHDLCRRRRINHGDPAVSMSSRHERKEVAGIGAALEDRPTRQPAVHYVVQATGFVESGAA
jgi:hypothetical protein